ncbi:MAG: rhodanese-like domain-containing protein [Eubacteriales bacterium]|nr:rhodanese-like domain-containing protein [Eubacteriales bacterium]
MGKRVIITLIVMGILLLLLILYNRFIANGRTEDMGNRISGQEALDMVRGGNCFILDVRTPGEFAEGHVRDAVNIPVNALQARLDEVPQDKRIILYCRSGARANRAMDMLLAAGYEDVYNFGGLKDWPEKPVR